mgnify:CR=1 FL=1
MTNGHSFDLEVQDQVLRGDFAYVGVIGSRKKTAAVNQKLRERGVPEEAIARVHTPIGTPIKAVTPEEIAVSITGELIYTRALRREANMIYGNYVEMTEYPAQSIQLRLVASESTGFTADTIAQNSGIDYTDKAKLLCQLNPVRRLEMAVQMLRQELEMLEIESDIQEKTKATIDQDQKDYYLREQIKAIQNELGEGENADSELAEYREKIAAAQLPDGGQYPPPIQRRSLRSLVPERDIPSEVRTFAACLTSVPFAHLPVLDVL